MSTLKNSGKCSLKKLNSLHDKLGSYIKGTCMTGNSEQMQDTVSHRKVHKEQ